MKCKVHPSACAPLAYLVLIAQCALGIAEPSINVTPGPAVTQSAAPRPALARTVPYVERLHGVEIADPYR
jgi:hypothetical protein